MPLPTSLAKGLRDIAALSQPDFDSLLGFLRSIPTEIRQYRVFNAPDFLIDSLTDKGQSVKDTTFSLLLSRAAGRTPIPEFITDLLISLDGSGYADDLAKDQLQSRLAEILNIKSLDLVARAHDVLTEHQQTFSSARTVSDIRSIFGSDVNEGPIGAVLVHMLSLVYYSTGERNTFVLALDDKDIDHLMEVLQ